MIGKVSRKCHKFSDTTSITVNNSKLEVQRCAKVHVVLVRAKDLPTRNSGAASGNLYCEISLGKEKFRSKMVPEDINPEWIEPFDFDWYSDQRCDSGELAIMDNELSISVRGKGSLTDLIDYRLCTVTIDLTSLKVEQTHHIWERLCSGTLGCPIKGQLHILLTISGTTSESSETNLKFMEDKLER